MKLKQIFSSINIFSLCKEYDLPLWQCPQFLFVVMGCLTILTSIIAFALGNRYIENLFLIDLIVLFLAVVMLVVSFIITQSFERMAEANRMKSEFVRIVSHQLRAPLTNFKWALELLSFKEYETEKIRSFEILRENSDRMEELVSDLLIVSRIKEGTLFIRESSVNLQILVEEIINRLGPFAKAHNVELFFDIEKGLPEIFSDPSQIKLLVEILLENAISYSKNHGEARVVINKEGSAIRISIKDQGLGVPEVDKRYLFNQFFRARNAIQYKPEGTGLGLFIAKSIINRLGGKIGFESKEGKGSTFWFILPIK